MLLGVCTHLGCLPQNRFEPAPSPTAAEARLAGRILLPLPRLQVRPLGPRVRGRAGADQPRDPALQLRRRHHIVIGLDQAKDGVMADPNAGGACNGRLARLGDWIDERFPMTALWKAHVSRVLRAEELQFLVLLRLARAAGAGDADRHRHLPDDELQARRDRGVRLGRVHHARRRVGLAHPLHALDRRVGVLHRRLPAHVPRR